MNHHYTFLCPCGSFAHDIDVMWAARLLALHHTHNPELYPAQMYAEAANDMWAEAQWVVSP